MLRLRGGGGGIAGTRQIWALYSRFCQQQPLLANLGTIGALALTGDALMQKIERRETFDADRCARFTLFRVVFTAPYYTVWYKLLEALVPTSPPARAVAIKTALDCLVSTPFQHAVFFSVQAWWEGCTDEAIERCVAVLPQSVPAAWAFWAPTQLITFGVVPAHLRVPFVNAVSLVWNVVLSGFNTKARTEVKRPGYVMKRTE